MIKGKCCRFKAAVGTMVGRATVASSRLISSMSGPVEDRYDKLNLVDLEL